MVWLTGWNRRKSKIIEGSTAGLQTDYQMKIIVHKGSGTDTATDIYLGTNVRDDFGDVRFTSSDGSTILNYWIESYTLGSTANIWVNIPSISASPSTTTIYIYYDNSIATSISNGPNTFIFFDDFDDNNIDISKWTKIENYGVTVTETGNVLKISGITNSNGGDDERFSYVKSIPTFGNVSFDVKMKNNSGNAGVGALQYFASPGFYSTYGYFDNWGGWDYLGFYNSNSWWNGDLFDPGNDGLSHLYSFRRVGTYLELWRDDILKTTKTNIKLGSGNINIILGAYARVPGNSVDAQFDDIRIRKYASVEPTFSTTGIEEVSGAPICPSGLKYEGDTVHLSATPRDGIGPYYVEFRKNSNPIASYTGAPEDIEITYDHILSNEDIRTAFSGTIDFSVYISDSCPTGAQSCGQICTIAIGCLAPVCNFTVA